MTTTHLPPVSKDALEALREQGDRIISEALSLSLQFEAESAHHGPDAARIIKKGFEFTHQMLLAAVSAGQVDLLIDQADWAVNRLPHDNVQMPNLLARLSRYREVLCGQIKPEHAREITPYLDVLIDRIESHLKA